MNDIFEKNSVTLILLKIFDIYLCHYFATNNKIAITHLWHAIEPQTTCQLITRLGQLGANISPDRSSLTPQVLIGNFLKHNYPLLYELQHINLLCLYLPKEDGVSPDAEYITQIIFSIFLQ